MCRRVTCPSCGKPTFAGCGRHVQDVLGDVPVSERCRCGATDARGRGGPVASVKRALACLVDTTARGRRTP